MGELAPSSGGGSATETRVSGNEEEGNFEIVGVDKESGYDTTWQVYAMSAANAKVKAELEGIIVTSVKWSNKPAANPMARK